MVGPEYPGEGAVQNIYSRVSSKVLEAHKKMKIGLEMCSCNTPKKSITKKSSVSLEPKASTTNTWRESGDWVALQNIKSRGSTHEIV